MDDHSRPIPDWIDVYARRVRAARDDAAKLRVVLKQSTVPMMLVDDDRRYVYANPPALRVFGLTLEELRELRLDDVAGAYRRSVMRAGWERFLASEFVLGHDIPRFGMANVLPGRHVIAFAPPDAPVRVAATEPEAHGLRAAVLTPRELEVLSLAAGGLTVGASPRSSCLPERRSGRTSRTSTESSRYAGEPRRWPRHLGWD